MRHRLRASAEQWTSQQSRRTPEADRSLEAISVSVPAATRPASQQQLTTLFLLNGFAHGKLDSAQLVSSPSSRPSSSSVQVSKAVNGIITGFSSPSKSFQHGEVVQTSKSAFIIRRLRKASKPSKTFGFLSTPLSSKNSLVTARARSVRA